MGNSPNYASIDEYADTFLDDDTEAIERRLDRAQEEYLAGLTPEAYQEWLTAQDEEYGLRHDRGVR